MEPIEFVLEIMPILVLLGGFLRYSFAETERRRDKRAAQLQDMRNQIQNDPAVARVMFLVETKGLDASFHLPSNDEKTVQIYMGVVKSIGLFDSICYSFLKNTIGKEEFIYFWGEMAGLYFDPSIREYLEELLDHNLRVYRDDTIDEDHLFESYYPYGYFQAAMRQNADDLPRISGMKLRQLMKQEMKTISKELYARLLSQPQEEQAK